MFVGVNKTPHSDADEGGLNGEGDLMNLSLVLEFSFQQVPNSVSFLFPLKNYLE